MRRRRAEVGPHGDPGRGRGGLKQRAIIFTTDAGFLMPTVSVIGQILEQKRVMDHADIILFLVDIDHDGAMRIADALADIPVSIIRVADELLEIPDAVNFNKTHVPRSTLARLAVGDLIAERYEHLLYIDGDVQILGEISALVEHDVAPGHIASVNEALWLYEGDAGSHWKTMASYLAGLGISEVKDYFNAGVLAFRRSTWLEKSREAQEFYFANSEICKYHDQSALNVVFHRRRETLSPIYNFSSGYAELGVAEEFGPRIVHFTGAAKPWFSRCHPWNGRFLPHYAALAEKRPMLTSFAARRSAAEIELIERDVEARRRKAMLRTPWRAPLRRRLLRRYMATTPFACA
jgi:lipopolysaccharide biosynthesis glycosyltransferase